MKSWRITVCKNVRDDYFERRNLHDYFFINEIHNLILSDTLANIENIVVFFL